MARLPALHLSKQTNRTRGWAQGKYGDWTFNVGKIPTAIDTQFLFDDELSGASIIYGKDFKVILQAGRWDLGSANSTIRGAGLTKADKAANWQAVGLEYKAGKFSANASYHHLSSDGFKNIGNYKDNGTTDDANIWSVCLSRRFNKAVAISGNYAQNTKADNYNHAHNIQLDIYGAKRAQKGTPMKKVGKSAQVIRFSKTFYFKPSTSTERNSLPDATLKKSSGALNFSSKGGFIS